MTITVEKRDHMGQFVTEYNGEIIERSDSHVCLRATFQRESANLGFVTFFKGDVFIEWFYSDRWYNIFQIHEGDSERLRGWYCNITRPAVLTDKRVWADDLALDLFVMPNGTTMLLDEDEFGNLNLPTTERMAALRAIQMLRKAVANRTPPFNRITRG